MLTSQDPLRSIRMEGTDKHRIEGQLFGFKKNAKFRHEFNGVEARIVEWLTLTYIQIQSPKDETGIVTD